MPQETANLGLLPNGVSMDNLEFESDSELDLSQAPRVEPSVLVSYISADNGSSSKQDLPFSSQYFDAKHFGFRLPSQESINSEDTDLDLSQKSLQSETNVTIPCESKETMVTASNIVNLPIPDGIIIPRSKTPTEHILENSDNVIADLESKLNPVTPTKPAGSDEKVDPWTPTANLKMLISAASPEIRNREKIKLLECNEDSLDSESSLLSTCTSEILPSNIAEAPTKPRRKQARKQKTEKLEDFEAMEFDGNLETVEVMTVTEPQTTTSSRKEKSLGLLCQR